MNIYDFRKSGRTLIIEKISYYIVYSYMLPVPVMNSSNWRSNEAGMLFFFLRFFKALILCLLTAALLKILTKADANDDKTKENKATPMMMTPSDSIFSSLFCGVISPYPTAVAVDTAQ